MTALALGQVFKGSAPITGLRIPRLTVRQLVKKHGGWWEGSIAYFPTVWAREQFQKERAL